MSTIATPPSALIRIAVSASRQHTESVSLVRETIDGLPIGWILRFGALHDDAALATVFAKPDGNGEPAFSYYLNREAVAAEQVSNWLQGLGAAPVDEAIYTLFEQAMGSGWEVNLERRDFSFLSSPTPNLLTLRAEASDYERDFDRESETVFVSRHEGDEGFSVIMRDSYEGGSYRPLRIDLAEATALLNNPAPMTVDIHVYDEDTEEWVLPTTKAGN